MLLPNKEKVSAETKWNTISKSNQQKLLANVLCGKCAITTIVDYSIENSQNDIVLRGKCAKCGGNVARVVEFDDLSRYSVWEYIFPACFISSLRA